MSGPVDVEVSEDVGADLGLHLSSPWLVPYRQQQPLADRLTAH